MFVPLFSDYQYEPMNWPAVFEIENMLQAILREDWLELSQLAQAELFTALRSRFRDFPSAMRCHLESNDALVDAFLQRELRAIAEFVSQMTTLDTSTAMSTVLRYLHLDRKRLAGYIAADAAFHAFIVGRRHTGHIPQ